VVYAGQLGKIGHRESISANSISLMVTVAVDILLTFGSLANSYLTVVFYQLITFGSLANSYLTAVFTNYLSFVLWLTVV
jgi:hypothetical protein